MQMQAQKYGLNLEYIWDFDVASLSASDLKQVESEALPKPSISAVLKHIEAQRRAVASGLSICLVLEDDVILFDGFEFKLKKTLALAKSLDPGWLIFLGGADNKIDNRFFRSIDFRLIENPLSTAEAYLLDIDGCRRRIDWLSGNKINKPADHFLKYLDEILNLRHYWVSEPMATQGSITGLFKTKLDLSRGKHSGIYLRLRYLYNRFRRQLAPRFFRKYKI